MIDLRKDLFDTMAELPIERSYSSDPYVRLQEITHRAFKCVFQSHLAAGHYKEVVDFALDQFDTGGSEDLVLLVSDELEKMHQTRDLIRLWKGYSATRKKTFWQTVSESKRRNPLISFPDSSVIPQKYVGKSMGVAEAKQIFEDLGGREQAQRLAIERRKTWALWSMQKLQDVLIRNNKIKEADEVAKEMSLVTAEKKPKISRDSRNMTIEVFWELMGATSCAESQQEKIDCLTGNLSAFRPKEIGKFAVLLDQFVEQLNHWDLWALAFIARDGCSDDAFDYFRAWVIMQGESIFRQAVAEPLSIASYLLPGQEMQCEELLYVASVAYENRTSRSFPTSKAAALSPIRVNTWNENELPLRYPDIWNKFRGH